MESMESMAHRTSESRDFRIFYDKRSILGYAHDYGPSHMENGLIRWTPCFHSHVAPRTVPKFQHPRPVLYSVRMCQSVEELSRKISCFVITGYSSKKNMTRPKWIELLWHITNGSIVVIWYIISTANCLSDKARVPVQRVSLAPRSCPLCCELK